MNKSSIHTSTMRQASKYEQLYTNPNARNYKNPKGRQLSISVSDMNHEQRVLETLDEYATEWKVSRSEAFFRMVKRYSLIDGTGQTLEDAGFAYGR